MPQILSPRRSARLKSEKLRLEARSDIASIYKWRWAPICCPQRFVDAFRSQEVDIQNRTIGDAKCVCRSPFQAYLTRNPGWQWFITQRGSRTFGRLMLASTSGGTASDVDILGDREARHLIQIQEGMLQSIHTAAISEKLGEMDKVLEVWSALEAASIWLLVRMETWMTLEDAARRKSLVRLWGATVVTTLAHFGTIDLLRDLGSGPIKDIQMVLTGFMLIALRWIMLTGETEDVEWTALIAASITKYRESFEGGPIMAIAHRIDRLQGRSVPSAGDIQLNDCGSWTAWSRDVHFERYAKTYGSEGRISGKQLSTAGIRLNSGLRYTPKAEDLKTSLHGIEGQLARKQYSGCISNPTVGFGSAIEFCEREESTGSDCSISMASNRLLQ